MLCTSLVVFMEDHKLRIPAAPVAPSLKDTLPASEYMENSIPPDWEPGQPPDSAPSGWLNLTQWELEPPSTDISGSLVSDSPSHCWRNSWGEQPRALPGPVVRAGMSAGPAGSIWWISSVAMQQQR